MKTTTVHKTTIRIRLLLLLAVAMLCSVAMAGSIDKQSAQQIGRKFLNDVRMRPGKQLHLVKQALRPEAPAGDKAYYYVFNVDADKGFVIVGGDDRAEEILGYSDTGHFDASNVPDGLADLLSGYEQQVSHVSSQAQRRVTKRADNGWADIEPMILTQWDQHAPYNNLCPIDPDDGRRCITGCTAVAFAQVMYYHQWPEIGYGRTSYKWNSQTLSADFYNVSFEWDKMKLEYDYEDTDEDQAVATLLYHCSLAAHAAFSSSNTPGSFNRDILTDHFGYKRTAKTLWLNNNSLANFEAIVYNPLQRGSYLKC